MLSTLAGWKFGFDSPFKAEVYFVSTRQVTDLKWGTPNPVLIRDPDFGPIRVRAFGTFTLRAVDAKALLQELVGTDSIFEVDEVGVLLRSIIGQAFADLVATADLSVVDLAANQNDLAEKLRKLVVERVDDEYGLDVPALFIVNVSVPEEVEKALDARSSMRVIDDLAAYQQYQVGAATKVAAANPAGGIAAGGIGVGMGLAMAGRMAMAPLRRRRPSRKRRRRPRRRPRGTSSRAVRRQAPSRSTTSRAPQPPARCAATRSSGPSACRAGPPSPKSPNSPAS